MKGGGWARSKVNSTGFTLLILVTSNVRVKFYSNNEQRNVLEKKVVLNQILLRNILPELEYMYPDQVWEN